MKWPLHPGREQQVVLFAADAVLPETYRSCGTCPIVGRDILLFAGTPKRL
jgi:hypothetical protein